MRNHVNPCVVQQDQWCQKESTLETRQGTIGIWSISSKKWYSPVGVFRVVDFIFFTWQHHDRVIHPIYYCPEKKRNENGKTHERKIFFILFYQMMIFVQIYFENIMLETEKMSETERWKRNNNNKSCFDAFVWSASAVYEPKAISSVCVSLECPTSSLNAFPCMTVQRRHILHCVCGLLAHTHTFTYHSFWWVINELQMRCFFFARNFIHSVLFIFQLCVCSVQLNVQSSFFPFAFYFMDIGY